MLIIWSIFFDLIRFTSLINMPSIQEFLQDIVRLIYMTMIHCLTKMSSIFRHWKNRLRCSNKRFIQQSRSSILAENEFKNVHSTMEKLLNENRILKERFDKLEERCQHWIHEEQSHLLKRIEQLEKENERLHETHQIYQRQSEKCLESVTDLIIKTLFTQEELRKQCTDLHQAIDTVQLREKIHRNDFSYPNTRSISCQFPSYSSNINHRHTTNDQCTWFHQQLMIVEENDEENQRQRRRRTESFELHISESQSSVYSPAMAAAKLKTHIPSTGLTNEVYFSSHKPDGDNERTPPVLMRNKRRSPHLNIVPCDGPNNIDNNNTRRPISSPARSTTYVLQQHHRINTNLPHKQPSPPVHRQQQSPSITPMTLNKTRQTQQQQRIFSNHERLPIQTTTAIDSSTLTSRTPIALTPRHTSPVIKNTPTKTLTTYNTSRSPRIPHTPPVRPSRPTVAIQPRSPRVSLRPPHLTPPNPRIISSPLTSNRTIRPQQATSKSPDQLRSVNGTVTRPRPGYSIVNKVKPTATNVKPRTSVPAPLPSQPQPPPPPPAPSSTARVSDLDALMAEQQYSQIPPNLPVKLSNISASPPMVNHIRCSLFSTDSVKVVRPVRSQELKIFSCHLTPQLSPPTQSSKVSDEITYPSNIDETCSTLTPSSSEHQTNNQSSDKQIILQKDDSSSSNTSAVLRDLSEDSLNSLNEHYHIRQLLKNNAPGTTTTTTTQHDLSNEDIPDPTAVTSWSRIRSSCDSNISHIVPLQSEISSSPTCYNGPVRQEDIQMAGDGRYFLLIDDNLSSEESEVSQSESSPIPPPVPSFTKLTSERKMLLHHLVFPTRLGRIVFYRRILSESDIYQKLCSKDTEIQHNVYHLDTIRDYATEFYMLATYGSDSQLRAWFDSNHGNDLGNNTSYFDDARFESLDDDDDDDDVDDGKRKQGNALKRISGSSSSSSSTSSDSIILDDDFKRLHVDEELDWYSELESFNLSSNNQQWRNENVSSCSSEDHVGELLRAEQFSVSSITTTTSADSSSSTGLISASWPLTNGIHYQVHSNRSSQSLSSPPISNIEDQSHTILKEILTYPWTHDVPTSNPPEIEHEPLENGPTSTSIVSEEFQPDFYYLCPLKNTNSFLKTDEKSNGIQKSISHDV